MPMEVEHLPLQLRRHNYCLSRPLSWRANSGGLDKRHTYISVNPSPLSAMLIESMMGTLLYSLRYKIDYCQLGERRLKRASVRDHMVPHAWPEYISHLLSTKIRKWELWRMQEHWSVVLVSRCSREKREREGVKRTNTASPS